MDEIIKFLLGMFLALPFALLISFLMKRAVFAKQQENPLQSHNRLMGMILLKMGISFTVLVIAGLLGEMYLFGAMLVLLLQLGIFIRKR